MSEVQDVDTSSVNLHAYSASYQGYTKIARLVFLMDTFPRLKTVAAKYLLKELKTGSNPTLYVKILQMVDESTRQELGCDDSIATTMQQTNHMKMEILESELSSAKSAVMKEGTRLAYNDIGHLWYQIGNLTEALKSYLRTRDLCTIARHNCEMALNVISVSIDLKQFFNVNNFVSKVTDAAGDDVVIAKLKVASAMADLYDQQYHAAALKFLDVNPVLGNQYNNVASAEDIAIYASICALATFDRTELRTKLVDNKSFLNAYLSLVPDFKTMVLGFCGGDYGQAFKLLNSVRPRLLCDLYLHSNVTQLVHMISERMLLQYFAPYSAVDLGRMASSLHLDAKTLEAALVRLISSGRLAARIDAQSNTMHRSTREVRHATLEKVRALSQVHAHAVKRDILRLSLMQQGFTVGDGEEGGQAGSGGYTRSSSGGGGGGVSSVVDLSSGHSSSMYPSQLDEEYLMASSGGAPSSYLSGPEVMNYEGESDNEAEMDYETTGAVGGSGAAAVSVSGSQASVPDLNEMEDDL